MARPRQEYLDFLNLVNPDGLDLRAAFWSRFFPDNVETRNPVTYEFKVSSSCLTWLVYFNSYLDNTADTRSPVDLL